MRRTRAVAALLSSILAAGCVPSVRRDGLPPGLAEGARVPGFDNVRFWADEKSQAFDESIQVKDIPGVFTPVKIPVLATDGKTYDEVHVDGGVTAEVVFIPPELRLAEIEKTIFGHAPQRTLYVLRNGKLKPDYAESKLTVLNVASRAVETMVKNQVIANLKTVNHAARDAGIAFLFNATPNAFDAVPHGLFDTAYALKVFDCGRDVGRTGRWLSQIPETPHLFVQEDDSPACRSGS